MEVFEGTKDPLDYMKTYKTYMHLQELLDEIMCRVFPLTLKGLARAWFGRLKLGSLDSFMDLNKTIYKSLHQRLEVSEARNLPLEYQAKEKGIIEGLHHLVQ